MSLLQRLSDWWSAPQIPIWYDPSYRLPFTTMQARVGFDPRRADLVLWFLEEEGILGKEQRRHPERIAYSDLARVHEAAWLEALSGPETLARVFALEAWDIQVDPLLSAIRMACGGTLAAAREALQLRGAALNLFGGFHHAYPGKGAGMCAVNDIAVAVA
ncbi:MAG TPA: histone deacetylase, partial [Myxococcota bacterium]|nr:histone deacetylase [Myxococcota bacterium]